MDEEYNDMKSKFLYDHHVAVKEFENKITYLSHLLKKYEHPQRDII